MKKLIYLTFIFMFIFTATSFAGFDYNYQDNDGNGRIKGNYDANGDGTYFTNMVYYLMFGGITNYIPTFSDSPTDGYAGVYSSSSKKLVWTDVFLESEATSALANKADNDHSHAVDLDCDGLADGVEDSVLSNYVLQTEYDNESIDLIITEPDLLDNDSVRILWLYSGEYSSGITLEYLKVESTASISDTYYLATVDDLQSSNEVTQHTISFDNDTSQVVTSFDNDTCGEDRYLILKLPSASDVSELHFYLRYRKN